jgi:hypothetical protein
VATHLAHKGLLLEECNAAVAAGSNVMLLAGTTAAICQLQVCNCIGWRGSKHAPDGAFSLVGV